MSFVISLKTPTERLLFNWNNVTNMQYSRNNLTVHHVDEPKLSEYEINYLTKVEFDDLVTYISKHFGIINLVNDNSINIINVDNIKTATLKYRGTQYAELNIYYVNGMITKMSTDGSSVEVVETIYDRIFTILHSKHKI